MQTRDVSSRAHDVASADRAPRDWASRLAALFDREGPAAVRDVLRSLQIESHRLGGGGQTAVQTAYANTIRPEDQPVFPGDREIEQRIRSLVRWNAVALVVKANREHPGLGGHLSTFASIATLYEIGQNHFFRGKDHECGGDHVYFQGHASPGNYARAFLEGRLDEEQMARFRREVDGRGLSSYPHPWLMPDFWEFPTVSMGLGPLQAIYRARFTRYLEQRELARRHGARVWCFAGDGEMDEPEALAGLAMAARERLANLTLVVNCNLQRLDGPVRGNGKIIQELEALFRGLGWHVIKLVWGSRWDELLARDETGALLKRLGTLLDGDYQRCATRDGAYLREIIFGAEELAPLVEHWSDRQLEGLKTGGHDPDKVYAAYQAAVERDDAPTVILAKTVKGYALGKRVEARNVTHQQKTLDDDTLRELRDRFAIPLADDALAECPFYRPDDRDPAIEYLHDRRRLLGGAVPRRTVVSCALPPPPDDLLADFFGGSDGRSVSTTMALVQLLAALMKAEPIGPRIVPIVPDEARTFGMDALFHEFGIYSSVGQKYEPVDADSLLHYRESRDGQVLEEGITEAGSMASFIAAGTAHACHGLGMIPFYFFYSMFGPQRIGDLVWAAGDARARGFLIGATAGRTTLNGEGLQHQDGHSHLLAMAVPNVRAYDPAYAYEAAVIIQDGIRRMYRDDEDLIYYLTAYNEPYEQPAMDPGAREGILRGMHRVRGTIDGRRKATVRLLGSGPLIRETLAAQELLAERFEIPAEVWSATSYTMLRRDALRAARWNTLHPAEHPRVSWIEQCFGDDPLVHIAVSDFDRALPDSIGRWVPGGLLSLGTDGYGRSDTRPVLRRFFEVDARFITLAALRGLADQGRDLGEADLARAVSELDIDAEKLDPLTAREVR